MIHETIKQALKTRPKRRLDGLLWVSDLGKNPNLAIKRFLTGELEEFDLPTLIKMDNGVALEAASLRQIAENSTQPIQTQVPLFNDIWSGYADVVFNFGKENVAIYDHKGRGGKWWDYKESLPSVSDCCQVWLYGQLYYEMYGIRPHTGLYYRGWGSWAEFNISFDGVGISAIGEVSNEKGTKVEYVSRYRRVNPYWLRQEIEALYVRRSELTVDDLQLPDGPDWDYAVDAYDRLATEQERLSTEWGVG